MPPRSREYKAAFVPTMESRSPTKVMPAAFAIPSVSLRHGFYAESSRYQLRGIKHTERLSLPEDGPVFWTARATSRKPLSGRSSIPKSERLFDVVPSSEVGQASQEVRSSFGSIVCVSNRQCVSGMSAQSTGSPAIDYVKDRAGRRQASTYFDGR